MFALASVPVNATISVDAPPALHQALSEAGLSVTDAEYKRAVEWITRYQSLLQHQADLVDDEVRLSPMNDEAHIDSCCMCPLFPAH